ncbi:ABC transporter permease [Parasalinivibrio latis]|uniref:ABC transporter permease n=1 Tax=Parasalinivibrio latis TaxID=2952610 RepID=UPI0030E079E2
MSDSVSLENTGKETHSRHSLRSRWVWRELRQGELWPIVAALTLIVATVFALAALAGRIENVLTDQGRNLLSADLVLRTAEPASEQWLQDAETAGLQVTRQTRFGTMAFSDEAMQLVRVRALGSAYPLRGELVLEGEKVNHSVQPGELWLEDRVFSLMGVKRGDTLDIGDKQYVISGRIASEPELSFNPFSQMPGVMVHQNDIESIGALQPGSRVSYRYYFSGPDESLTALKSGYTLNPGERWTDENTPGQTGDMLERSRQYLALTVMLVVIMAAVTLVLTCRHYVRSRVAVIAMLKSLGAGKQWLRTWLAWQLAGLFSVAIIAGWAGGYLIEWLLRLPLVDVLPQPVPGFGWQPWAVAPLAAILVSIPALGIPLVSLLAAPAKAVMQPEALPSPWRNGYSWLMLAIPPAVMGVWAAGNTLLWMVLGAMLVMIVLLAFIGMLVFRGARRYATKPALKLALSRIVRSPFASGIQLGALACSLMLVAVIWLLRTDLLEDWQQTLPDGAPNVFAINISERVVPDYTAVLDRQQILRSEAYPILRGRLVAQNGENLLDRPGEKDESLQRELNFTWRETLPSHNVVLEGKWPTAGGVSVEEGIAERMGIKLGDTLTFAVSGRDYQAEVNSIRQVEWRNMKPNFYFIFDPELFSKMAYSAILSFRLEADQTPILDSLSRDYPTVTVLDLRTMSDRIQVILRQVSLSLSVLAGLAVLSGLLLLFTLLRLSLAERQQEIKLYRTLGAARKRITATLWFEFGMMAVVAGLIAVGGAELAMSALMEFGFELPAKLHPEMWVVLPLAALMLIGATVATMLRKLLVPLRS